MKVTSNKSARTFTIKNETAKYRTYPMSKQEFNSNLYNTENDWKQFFKLDEYYKVNKMEQKIIEILEEMEDQFETAGYYGSFAGYGIKREDYQKLAERIVKLFPIPPVSGLVCGKCNEATDMRIGGLCSQCRSEEDSKQIINILQNDYKRI